MSTDTLTENTAKTLRINDTAPDFTAETTQGTINFHEWIGDGWAVLFSHPKDFTPVCTTELGYMAGLQPEFAKRNTKIIGLSVDPVTNHSKWAADIEETLAGMKVQGAADAVEFRDLRVLERLVRRLKESGGVEHPRVQEVLVEGIRAAVVKSDIFGGSNAAGRNLRAAGSLKARGQDSLLRRVAGN